MDGNHSTSVPQLPNINVLFMDCAVSKSNDEDNAPSRSPSSSPCPEHFFFDSKIHDAIAASERDLTRCLSDFHAATTTAVAAARTGAAVAADAYTREAEACHARVLEAQAEFREAVVMSLAGPEELRGAVEVASFGLGVQLAAATAALERQQAALYAAHEHAASQFCKATDAAAARLQAGNAQVADTFSTSICSLLPNGFELMLHPAAGSAVHTASDPERYELEKYKTVMQMMNVAYSIHNKKQNLTSH
ncbi:uncharacterized protein LOC134537250 [Bacillus rossius redtenbacheri]|uniref:uncharacterized protein LOC134537250 n=1 Tax=Bacillus rossius redtenbacheri TaxID=93214 RepID=UPI002FDECF35